MKKLNIGSGPHCGGTKFSTDGWICVDDAFVSWLIQLLGFCSVCCALEGTD